VSVPLCAYEKADESWEMRLWTGEWTDLAVLLFLFVPAKNRRRSCKLLIRFGVPDGI
jgi:hypothetical protein